MALHLPLTRRLFSPFQTPHTPTHSCCYILLQLPPMTWMVYLYPTHMSNHCYFLCYPLLRHATQTVTSSPHFSLSIPPLHSVCLLLSHAFHFIHSSFFTLLIKNTEHWNLFDWAKTVSALICLIWKPAYCCHHYWPPYLPAYLPVSVHTGRESGRTWPLWTAQLVGLKTQPRSSSPILLVYCFPQGFWNFKKSEYSRT